MRVFDTAKIFEGKCVVMQVLSTEISCLLKYRSRNTTIHNAYLISSILINIAVSTSLIPVAVGLFCTAMITCRVS